MSAVYALHIEMRLLIRAESPGLALMWAEGDPRVTVGEVKPMGHRATVVEIDHETATRLHLIHPPSEADYDLAHGIRPCFSEWSPEAWPPRASLVKSEDRIVSVPEADWEPVTLESDEPVPDEPSVMFARVQRSIEDTVDDTAQRVTVAEIAAHELNYHDRGPQAFHGWTLLHELEDDADLRREIRKVLLS